MNVLALLAVAFVQLISLDLDQLGKTVEAIASALVDQYVEPAEGARRGRALTEEFSRGGFAAATDPDAFAAAVQHLLQGQSRDKHLLVWHGQPANLVTLAGDRLKGPSIGKVEQRPDGIGYVEVRHFLSESQGNPESAVQIDGAMRVVSGASALILDLRMNPGGDFPPLTRLAGYLFASPTHLLTRAVRGRPGPTELWTQDELPGARLPNVAVYVLTSADTFSAGEAFAFALQKAGRATIVGERTGGGGYSGTFARLPNGFTMFMPTGRTVDPRTGQGWQVEGVHPDREVPASEALDAALRLAHEQITGSGGPGESGEPR